MSNPRTILLNEFNRVRGLLEDRLEMEDEMVWKENAVKIRVLSFLLKEMGFTSDIKYSGKILKGELWIVYAEQLILEARELNKNVWGVRK